MQKKKVELGYMKPHTPQLNGLIKRIFSFIKEGVLAIVLNVKLNDTYHKIMWAEAVCKCKCVRNSVANTGSMNSPFEYVYEEKLKIIYSFSEFGRTAYINKRYKFKK